MENQIGKSGNWSRGCWASWDGAEQVPQLMGPHEGTDLQSGVWGREPPCAHMWPGWLGSLCLKRGGGREGEETDSGRGWRIPLAYDRHHVRPAPSPEPPGAGRGWGQGAQEHCHLAPWLSPVWGAGAGTEQSGKDDARWTLVRNADIKLVSKAPGEASEGAQVSGPAATSRPVLAPLSSGASLGLACDPAVRPSGKGEQWCSGVPCPPLQVLRVTVTPRRPHPRSRDKGFTQLKRVWRALDLMSCDVDPGFGGDRHEGFFPRILHV